MSNNTHTTGPWSADFVKGDPITYAIQPGRRQDAWTVQPLPENVEGSKFPNYKNGCAIICSCHGPDMEANARLIAAAPEMLEAMKSVLRDASTDIEGISRDEAMSVLSAVCDIARASIAKATAQ